AFSSQGSVQVMLFRFALPVASGPDVDGWSLNVHDADDTPWLYPLWSRWNGALGFCLFRQEGVSGLGWNRPHTVVTVPLWSIIAVLSGLAVPRFCGSIRRRHRAGFGLSCGDDIRAASACA